VMDLLLLLATVGVAFANPSPSPSLLESQATTETAHAAAAGASTKYPLSTQAAFYGGMPVSFPVAGVPTSSLPISPVAAVVTVDQPGITVDASNGFVISLPAPPPPPSGLPDWDDFAPDCHQPGCPPTEQSVEADSARIERLNARLAQTDSELQQHDVWLEQATRAVEKLHAEMKDVEGHRAAISHTKDRLSREKKELSQRSYEDALAAKLRAAKVELQRLSSVTDDMKAAHSALSRQRTKVEDQMVTIGKRMKLNRNQLLAKIQEFRDDQNELSLMGQPPNDNPDAQAQFDLWKNDP